MKFGFIGAGNMGSAIIKGMLSGENPCSAADILVTSGTMRTADALAAEYGVQPCPSATALVAQSDVVILAVKPHILMQLLPALAPAIKAKQPAPLLVSIAAGKSLADIGALLPTGTPIVRVMPNINAKIGAATSGICANDAVSAEQRALAEEIFGKIGTVIAIEESQFGIFTVLAGSAPAFAYLYIDALARAAVRAGMSKKQALEITAATVAGSARMILESGEHPAALADQVCSPGGTTIEGVLSLQESGFADALKKAFDAVLEKDKRL